MKRKMESAAEYDTFCNRRIYCYLDRAGVASGIKRQARRRERHDAKQDIRQEKDQ